MRVLIVDDSKVVRSVLRKELSLSGYELVEASSGQEALEILGSEDIALVTLDIDMPEMDGYQTCQAIRQLHSADEPRLRSVSAIPIIFVAADDSLEGRIKGFESGASEFVSKNFNKGELSELVSRHLEPSKQFDGMKALVVEHDFILSVLIGNCLNLLGLDWIDVSDSEGAISAVRKSPSEWDFLIISEDLADMSGFDLGRQLRFELGRDEIPLLYLLPDSKKEERLEVFKAGGVDYLIKPFVEEEFIARTKVHLQNLQLLRRVEGSRQLTEDEAIARGAFLANISHEFRTPLNGIVGMTELMGTTEPSGEQKEYLENISVSADHLLSLINDILDYSKIEAGKIELSPAVFEFRDYLLKLTSVLKPKIAEKEIEFVVSISEDIPEKLFGDSHRLGQAILNVLSNAVKYTDIGGKVDLSIELESVSNDKAQMSVTVVDTGIGIPANRIEHIFGAFNQAEGATSRKYGGTGLGLAITSELVKLLGGAISVESEVGKGSSFQFSIAMQIPTEAQLRTEEQHKPPTEESATSSHLPKLKVLLVEDQVINQRVATRMLEKLGHSVVLATNGREALEVLEQAAIDLILMDCQMPEMDGYEATNHIRNSEAQYRDIPILALTGNAAEEDFDRCKAAGMDDLLAKPFTKAKLLELLERNYRSSGASS